MTANFTLTFAGDEAGDVSFNFRKGASRYFVATLIGTQSPDSLRQLLADLRQNSGLPATYEFKFHALSSAALRERVFSALAKADFSAWVVVVDKPSLADVFKTMNGLEFYLYFMTELLGSIPPEKRQNATLILDEFGSTPNLRMELRRIMDARGVPRQFKRVLIRSSARESLIQAADLVAGAILRRDAKRDSGAFEYVAHKMINVLEYRGLIK
jgi:hypothetical protein